MNQAEPIFNEHQILRAYEFNLRYAEDLVQDVADEQLYHSPGPGLENHPGFTLGHLVIASALIREDVGGTYEVPPGWDELFRRTGPGDPRLPSTNTGDLPSGKILISELGRQHARVEEGIRGLDAGQFAHPLEWRFDTYFPTVGDMLTFMCITHEAMHLAQIAAWRRACGLESSLARL